MISERIGGWVRQQMLVVGRLLGRLGFTPNMLTVIGFALNVVVAIIIASGHLALGGVLLLFSSGFDVLDGAVARATGNMTKFGGFFDSTVDRYSEIVVYVGVLWYLLGTDDWKNAALLTVIAAVGALMISYARARAEAAGWKASVGFLARPERVVILSVALIVGHPMWALWVLAIGTHLTALWRIIHVWRLASEQPDPEISAADQPVKQSTK